MISPRLRHTLLRGLAVGAIFFIIRMLIRLFPGRAADPLLQDVFLAVVIAIAWGIFSWLSWPREQERLAERQRRKQQEG